MSALTIFTDGGSRSNPGPAAWGVVVLNETGQTLHEAGQAIGVATNNEAEYQGFLASLQWLQGFLTTAQASEVPTHITWKLDSKLVVEQLLKNWKIKEPRMAVFAQQAWKIIDTLPCSYSIVHVPRAENARADFLVNQALDQA